MKVLAQLYGEQQWKCHVVINRLLDMVYCLTPCLLLET